MAKYSSHLPRDSYTDCFFKAVLSIHKGNFRQAQMVRYVNGVTVHIYMCACMYVCMYIKYVCMYIHVCVCICIIMYTCRFVHVKVLFCKSYFYPLHYSQSIWQEMHWIMN